MQQTADFDILPAAQGPVIHQPAFDPALLGVFTDFKTLCAPHIPAVRDVLTGQQYRYKLHYNNATFIFHHGCLMVQVVQNGIMHNLPPFALNEDGTPYLVAMPKHQKQCFDEFLTLPKSTVLFYFTLLKEVFKGYALRSRRENPSNGKISWVPVAEELRPILAEAGWNVR